MANTSNKTLDDRIEERVAARVAALEAEFEEKLSAALAAVGAANRVEDQGGNQLTADALGEAIAKALGEAQRGRIFKTSRKPFEPVPEDEILTPMNFNILEEATKRAHALGYVLGPWRRFQADNASPLVGELPEDWIAVCTVTRQTARARWMPPVKNDPQKRWRPEFTGDALLYPAGGQQSLDEQFQHAFPGARMSQMAGSDGAGAAGFSTTAVERPE